MAAHYDASVDTVLKKIQEVCKLALKSILCTNVPNTVHAHICFYIVHHTEHFNRICKQTLHTDAY